MVNCHEQGKNCLSIYYSNQVWVPQGNYMDKHDILTRMLHDSYKSTKGLSVGHSKSGRGSGSDYIFRQDSKQNYQQVIIEINKFESKGSSFFVIFQRDKAKFRICRQEKKVWLGGDNTPKPRVLCRCICVRAGLMWFNTSMKKTFSQNNMKMMTDDICVERRRRKFDLHAVERNKTFEKKHSW